MTAEELLKTLEGSPLERLKWHVLRRFGILPGSKAAKRLSDEDVIICGAHMALDHRKRSATPGGEDMAQNSSFDDERFAELSEGKL